MTLRFKAISMIRGAYKNMKKRFGNHLKKRLQNLIRQYMTIQNVNIHLASQKKAKKIFKYIIDVNDHNFQTFRFYQ